MLKNYNFLRESFVYVKHEYKKIIQKCESIQQLIKSSDKKLWQNIWGLQIIEIFYNDWK
jgi:hypothetical protein